MAFGDSQRVATRQHTFADVGTGAVGLVVDSCGMLALVQDQRSAAADLGLGPVEGRPAADPASAPQARFHLVTPDYFKAMKIALLKGRDFTDRDELQTPLVAVINETMAKYYFGSGSALGRGWLRSLAYFACLGAGFMLIEIGLMQRFVLGAQKEAGAA